MTVSPQADRAPAHPARRSFLGLATAVLVLGCVDGPTGPGNYAPVSLTLRVALPAGTPDEWLPDGDSLRVAVRRAGRVEPLVLGTVGLGSTAETTIKVPLAFAVERFVAAAEVVVNRQLLFLAVAPLELRAGTDTTVAIAAQYVGPGLRAARLELTARDTLLRRGDTTRFNVAAFDSSGAPMGAVPVRFRTGRTGIVSVDSLGLTTALADAAADTVRVHAVLPTGLSASALVRVRGTGQPVSAERIAFISTRSGNRDVWIMNADGSGARALTSTPEPEAWPAWSPDRGRVAFERRVNGAWQLFSATSDGEVEVQLTMVGDNRRARWSPDGQRIAFTTTRAGTSEVWVMNPDGANQRRLLPPDTLGNEMGDWSPDGRRIAYVRRPSASGSGAWPFAIDTSGANRVMLGGDCDCDPFRNTATFSVRWSPLGGEVTWAASYASRDTLLQAARPDGRSVAGPIVNASTSFDGAPSYAAAADTFVLESETGGIHGVYRAARGGVASRLSPAGVAEFEPDFAPAASPFHVERVTASPAGTNMTSDRAPRTFTATVADVAGRVLPLDVGWVQPSDGRVRAGSSSGEFVAIAPGASRVIANWSGWRADTVELTIATATGPTSAMLAVSANFGIWTLRGDGSALASLTPSPAANNGDPAWSPDGTRIAWTSHAEGGDVWVMNADGSGRTRLTTEAAFDGYPSWSPDGRQIVFSSSRAGGRYALWIMNADGSAPRRLTTTEGAADHFDAAWSPDGSVIAYARAAGTGVSIWTVSPVGGPPAGVQGTAGRYPSWSADSRTLWYSGGTPSRLRRVAYPGGTPEDVTAGTGGGEFEPSVSAEGLVLFWAFRNSLSNGQQMIMRADGTAQSGLLPVEAAGGIVHSSGGAWRPSSPPRYVATVAIGGDTVAPVPVDSTRQLSASGRDASGAALAPVGGYRWTSLDTTVATVSASGLVRARTAGTTRIVLASGIAVPDSATITVSAPPSGITRVWVGGAAAAPTDWSTPANWTPAGVPGTADTVRIATAASQPVLSASARVARVVIVAGGHLNLGGRALRVSGDFATGPDGGRLTMQSPADTLDVRGSVQFSGDPLVGRITAGVLRVGGDFRQSYVGGNWDAFQASGTHRTVLDGASLQRITIENGGTSGQRSFFNHLTIAKGAGDVELTAGSNAVANGVLRLTSGRITGAGALSVGDTLATAAGTSVDPASVELRGPMAVAGTFAPQSTVFAGAGQTIQAALGYRAVTVIGSARLAGRTTFDGAANVAHINNGGNVTTGDLDLNGHSLTVTGDFATSESGGTLTMRAASDTLNVRGSVLFAGQPTGGRLTAGVVRVGRNFRQFYVGSNWEAFQATGTHRTVFDGEGDQEVRFDTPGVRGQSSFFHHLVVDKTSGVLVVRTGAHANGVGRLARGAIEGDGTLGIGDTVVTGTGTRLAPTALRLGGPMAVAGTLDAPSVEFFGSAQRIQGGLGYRAVRVTGQAVLGGNATLAGSLGIGSRNLDGNVVAGDLDLGGRTLVVAGNFDTEADGGALTMRSAGDTLDVRGSVRFAGQPTTGRLTAGVLRVGGDFRQAYVGSNWDAFRATGTHRTVLAGAGTQLVRLENPGAAGQSSGFHHLEIAKPSGDVVLAGDAVATGTLVAQSTFTPVVRGDASRRLSVAGVQVAGLVLDSVALAIGAGPLAQLDDVVFRRQDPSAVQLDVASPGVSPEPVFRAPRFQTVPTTGRYVRATDTAPDDGFTLRIRLLNASPADGSPFTTVAGGAEVLWVTTLLGAAIP